MNKPGIKDLLIRCVLEPELLQALRESPENLFDDFDIDNRAREILSSPDARLLELLGEAVGHRTNEPTPASKEDPKRESSQQTVALHEAGGVTLLPQSRIALRLVPYVQHAPPSTGDAPEVIVNYAGHLDPLPGCVELGDLPEVPAAVTDGQQLPPVSVVVGVQPTVWTDDAGNRQMTFSVSARLPQDGVNEDVGDSTDVRLSPWRHDVDSSEAKSAADRVREAEPGDRYRRLRDMVDVMVGSPGDAR